MWKICILIVFITKQNLPEIYTVLEFEWSDFSMKVALLDLLFVIRSISKRVISLYQHITMNNLIWWLKLLTEDDGVLFDMENLYLSMIEVNVGTLSNYLCMVIAKLSCLIYSCA